QDIWPFPAPRSVRFAKSWPTAPTIVAESLVGVPDVLLTALRPGTPASGAAVAGFLARSLRPPEQPVAAPSWLLPAQVRSFRRVLAALGRFGGALLADPVGSGKTYVALAAAAASNRGSTACLVPAALIPQWQATADRLAIPITPCSHEQISRGRLPAGTRGLVLIDESHHFRNPDTRRYQHLAPWLVGRPALLLSATPVVNRIGDLLHQLLLTIRDDALAGNGVPSLAGMLAEGRSHPSLGQVLFEQDTEALFRPTRVYTGSMATSEENSAIARSINQLSQLRLSRAEPVAGLIRGVLCRALASSPAAYIHSLRRYQLLLLHARDAQATGRTFHRAALRRFVGQMEDQLVFWELFACAGRDTDIDPADLNTVCRLLAEAIGMRPEDDGKLHRLRCLLGDNIPTLVFTASRDTVDYLRKQLSDLGVAWCTGERAGIGNASMPRRVVLGWFSQPTDMPGAPRHLIVTDVAAEGLDLPRAARVVHYDLPWTPMRLEQREGRSIRYGSAHKAIETVQFHLPPALERRLGIEATLIRKEALPASAGLGSGGRRLWRWRSELAELSPAVEPQEGVAIVGSETSGLLAGFLLWARGQQYPSSATVVWLEEDGSWTEAPEIIESRIKEAAADCRVLPYSVQQLNHWLSLLVKPIRSRLASARSTRWITAEPSPCVRRVVSRLQGLMQDAARQRDLHRLAELERSMAFVAGGHTAGEAALVERLALAPVSELRLLLAGLPSRQHAPHQLEVRLTGLVLFQPPHSIAARVVSPACSDYKPHCSTSTEP
ncbi:MAG TPA: helicase-related protein, partial [Gemmatimonadales bacterium]|nr:helicase-related protein [Gemmatimonadales bacterium]